VDHALWKRANEAPVVVAELMCIGGRIFRRERNDGAGNILEGAKETGSVASWARSEGLWSRSLSLFGSYDPSPSMIESAWCAQTIPFTSRARKQAVESAKEHTFKIGS
jgi:hypothetical protein